MIFHDKTPKVGQTRIRHFFAIRPVFIVHDRNIRWPKYWLEKMYKIQIFNPTSYSKHTWTLLEVGPRRLCPCCDPKNTEISKDQFYQLCADPKLTLTEIRIKELNK